MLRCKVTGELLEVYEGQPCGWRRNVPRRYKNEADWHYYTDYRCARERYHAGGHYYIDNCHLDQWCPESRVVSAWYGNAKWLAQIQQLPEDFE